MSGVNVGGHTPANVDAGTLCPNQLACTRIVHRCAGCFEANGIVFIFVDREDFQAGAVWIHIADVHRVTVSHAR
jgi:hypothetical protein